MEAMVLKYTSYIAFIKGIICWIAVNISEFHFFHTNTRVLSILYRKIGD